MEPDDDAPTHRPRLNLARWGPRAAFESLLIVFSVVLALALTNWAEERKTAAQVAEARQFFIAEIRANREILLSEPILPHHRRLRRIFNVAAGQNSPTVDDAMNAYGAVFETGLHVPPLRDAVWRSAQTGDILGEMPLEEVFLLADVYAAQGRLSQTSGQFVSGVPALLGQLEQGRGVRAALVSGQLTLGDVVAGEEGLVQLYDRALARLDPNGTPATSTPGDAGRKGG